MELHIDLRLNAELDWRIEELCHRFARTIAEDARAIYPRSATDAQHTADTIRVEGSKVFVGDGTPLWHWIEYGTRPHWIRPKHKRALFWPGLEHPVRAVFHPGTPEFGPMRQALYQRRRYLLP